MKPLKAEERRLKKFDWLMFILPIILTILGIITIYSSTRPLFEGSQPSFYIRQSAWLVISIAAMLVTLTVDYRKLIKYGYYLYAFGIILLLLTTLIGHAGMGAQRWIRIGPLSFQPSEIFRLILIIATARLLYSEKSPLNFKPLLILFIIFGGIPFILLYKQPDLGTAIVLLSIMVIMVLVKGIPRRLFVSALLIITISIPFTGNVIWEGLKGYQRNRLIAFINPASDPHGIGYQIEQSKITIGSGRLTGKGYLKGTQGPLRFLPEKHTDFAFSVFAEEWGFAGSAIVIALYALLIIRGFETAYYARNNFGTLLAAGISSMFILYITINIGMTLGLAPVVGVPLPFFSYGGTALLANFICTGLLINIRMRRLTAFY